MNVSMWLQRVHRTLRSQTIIFLGSRIKSATFVLPWSLPHIRCQSHTSDGLAGSWPGPLSRQQQAMKVTMPPYNRKAYPGSLHKRTAEIDHIGPCAKTVHEDEKQPVRERHLIPRIRNAPHDCDVGEEDTY